MGVSRGGRIGWIGEIGVIVQAHLFRFPEHTFSGASEKCDKMGICVACQLTSMSDSLPL
jgi:hypothetical protein